MTKYSKIFTLLLRLLAFAATASAAVVMAPSHDSAKVLNLTFEAKYSNTPAFTLITLLLSSKINSLCRLVIILDSVIVVVLSSSISAALAIADVGKKGNSHAGWLPIVDKCLSSAAMSPDLFRCGWRCARGRSGGGVRRLTIATERPHLRRRLSLSSFISGILHLLQSVLMSEWGRRLSGVVGSGEGREENEK
ncbi:hypothetical protein L484_014519 [Morus notabilis]|uniref:CASP-like protein n=1 Tax=Morus notabilis TaxID=981085 RepID=W9SNA8_9ROSA|nr:hypothetical protein L484_014519 [Morus notabilis]